MQTHPVTHNDMPLEARLHALHDLGEAAQKVSGMVKAAFDDTLARIVARTMGDGPEAGRALADGGLIMNDRTVVVRLNPETDFVELFCDVGQPAMHSREDVYRAALEANLCRKFPGLTLGVHPESGRLVATLTIDGLLFDNEELCMTVLENLTQGAWQIRESGLFRFED